MIVRRSGDRRHRRHYCCNHSFFQICWNLQWYLFILLVVVIENQDVVVSSFIRSSTYLLTGVVVPSESYSSTTRAFVLHHKQVTCDQRKWIQNPFNQQQPQQQQQRRRQQRAATANGDDNGGNSRQQQEQKVSVYLDPTLSDERIRGLYAWVSRAFEGDSRYDNLMVAFAAIFGVNLDKSSIPAKMLQQALDKLPEDEETLTGTPLSNYQREQASLGAMGAAQWMGQWTTRPHALLDIRNMTCVEDDYVKTLSRGCRRTLKKAQEQNFTITVKPIKGRQSAPHSSLSHFKCVVEHEVRLLKNMYGEDDVNGFFSALAESISRYQGTTRMTGTIREYRLGGNIIAFAHEVRKGRTIRGQWFYATDQASKSYVWFHSVYDLVKRAISLNGVDVVDLGPSGSDSFSDLKEKYKFRSIRDWPSVADYHGPFWYEHSNGTYYEAPEEEEDSIVSMLRDMFR